MTTTEESVIRIAWRTPATKATSFFYVHRRCYTGSSLPNQEVSELPIEDIGCNAVCIVCRRKVKEGQ